MNTKPRVALLVTCLVDQALPEIGVSTVRLLRRAGYDVTFPADQTCCGQPFFNSGLRHEARRLARRTIDIFGDHEAVVLPSGSCTTMIRKEYPHLFEDDPAYSAKARELAARTYELSEFLVHQAGPRSPTPDPQPPAPDPQLTYHDSCHMCRMLGLRQEPRQLLAEVGQAIAEMEESDRCCGFGGVFSVRMPEVSNAMTAEKLRQALATGAGTLVTADPGCLMQMRGMLPPDSPLRIVHLATFLDEAGL